MKRHPNSWYLNDSNREPVTPDPLIEVPEAEMRRAINASPANYKVAAAALWMHRRKVERGMWKFTDCEPVRDALREIGLEVTA